MKIDGSCHCGAIRYEAEIDPADVSLCHCTDCQVLTGSPYRLSVPARPDAFRFTGTPRFYVKTGESGTRRQQHFCPDCGTPLFATNEGEATTYSIRWGSIHQRHALPPTRQIWCRSAVPWLDVGGNPPAWPRG